jgi:hypothetical protein
MYLSHRESLGVIGLCLMRKPELFRGPGKVPGEVLRKPDKTGGPEKFRVGLDIFNIHLLNVSKRFRD